MSYLLEESTVIEPEQLVGTKWTSWNNLCGDRMSVEFVDRSSCVYTLQPNKFKMPYNVREGKVFIKNIKGSFELRGEVLFNNDLPALEKAA